MKSTAILLTSLMIFCNATAQNMRIHYDDYLDAIGYGDEGIVMRSILNHGLMDRFPGESDDFYSHRSSFFAMILLVNGVLPYHIYQLEEEGIDLIHAITSDVRPFTEQSLFADAGVLAEVINVETGRPENDGFDVTVTIKTEQFLKGSAPSDTLYLRQRNLSRLSDSATRPEAGNRYLFLLSSGMYQYQSANYQFAESGEAEVRKPQTGLEDTFVIYRMYPFRNGRLQFSHQDFETVERELRITDRLLNPD